MNTFNKSIYIETPDKNSKYIWQKVPKLESKKTKKFSY